MSISFETHEDFMRDSWLFSASVPGGELRTRQMQAAIMQQICQEMAKRYVAEHFQEIAALLDPNAIANLTVAEAAGAIARVLKEKLPDVVREIHHEHHGTPAVFQRGVFGGLKRML